MTQNERMRTILITLAAEMDRLEAIGDRVPVGMDRESWRPIRYESLEYRAHGIPYDSTRWLGQSLSRSEAAVLSRDLQHMQQMGLVVRINRWGGHRTTHVRLTRAGQQEARRLLQEQEAEMDRLLAELGPIMMPDLVGTT
jgi:hypothetical protein